MLITLCAVALLLFVAILLVIYLRHGIPPDLKLLHDAVPLATRLEDALESGDDAELLAAVGGSAGLRTIRRTIRSMGAYARMTDHPEARKLAWGSWWTFFVYGWQAWLESKIHARFPNAPISSIESLARNYCCMCAIMDAIASMYSYV